MLIFKYEENRRCYDDLQDLRIAIFLNVLKTSFKMYDKKNHIIIYYLIMRDWK